MDEFGFQGFLVGVAIREGDLQPLGFWCGVTQLLLLRAYGLG